MRKARILFWGIVLTIGSLIVVSCSLKWLAKPTWEPPKVVSVEGGDGRLIWQQNGLSRYLPVKKGQPTQLPLRGGDLLNGDNAVLVYLDSDGPVISVKCNEYRTELNGKTVSLNLEKEEAWEWMEKAMPVELSALRLIVMRNEIDAKRMESLRRLSQVNPHVGLFIGSNVALQQVLPLFDPRFIFLGDCSLGRDDLAILAKKRRVETLFIPGETGDMSFLSKLANLDTLFLCEWDPSVSGPLPENLGNLRRLILIGPKIKDFSSLGKQPQLDELRLVISPIDSLDGISNFPALKEIGLVLCENLKDLSPLKQMKQLKWLGLPSATTQEQLENVVRDHPDLVGLELFEARKVTDLSVLKELRNLKYLLLSTPNANLDLILSMKGLRWLAVSFKDEETAVKIQTALPETAVACVNPVCLGSGWILLLAPAVAFTCWVEKRRRKAASRGYGL